ncbi:MAG: hypothetical protein OXN83_04315 [Oligoflexia bacterium]|nr:hypothetical protein [Oligoflexia bacterium]
MNNKNKSSSYRIQTIKKNKDINSYGYNVSSFSELDIPVKRDSETGKLVSIHKKSQKKYLNESS